VILRQALVALLARAAQEVQNLRRAARQDLGGAVRVRLELEVLPAVAFLVELAAALRHRLEREELEDRADGIALAELARLRLPERLLHDALLPEDAEELALGLRAVRETAEVLRLRDEFFRDRQVP
jgi:hypothetical protein